MRRRAFLPTSWWSWGKRSSLSCWYQGGFTTWTSRDPRTHVPPSGLSSRSCHRSSWCQSVGRRWERLTHWRAWRASGIRTISELCSRRAIQSRRDPFLVQTLLCKKFGACSRGRKLASRRYDIAAGALGELCGLRVGYHGDECGPPVPFQPGLPALGRAGSKPIDTVICLPSKARGLPETWRHSLLRDPKDAELLRAEPGLVKPRIGATRRSIQLIFASSLSGGSDHSRPTC